MKNYFRSLSVVLTLVLTLAAGALAQEQFGNIEGTITDQAGAVVPNVTVTVVNKGSGSGLTRTATTNGDGFFRALLLPPGKYTVSTAAVSGFKATKYDNVNVTVGNTVAVDIALTIGTGDIVVDVDANDSTPIDPSGSKVLTGLAPGKP